MSVSSEENCPFCGSNSLQTKFECRDYTVSDEQFEIKICTECAGGFTAGAPSEIEIAPYYRSENYISHSDSREGLTNRLYHFARKIMLNQKTKLISRLNGGKTGHLIEIGAGTAYFAASAAEAGWDVEAYEPDPEAREFAREIFELEVRSTGAFFASDNEKKADTVTLWHVLEHVHELSAMLTKIGQRLKKGGFLVLALPNHTCYDAEHYGAEWAGWDVPRHLWHFAPQTVNTLAGRFGFSVREHYGMPFDPFYVSILSEKYRENKFAFLRGGAIGLASFLQGTADVKKASSVIYILEKL